MLIFSYRKAFSCSIDEVVAKGGLVGDATSFLRISVAAQFPNASEEMHLSSIMSLHFIYPIRSALYASLFVISTHHSSIVNDEPISVHERNARRLLSELRTQTYAQISISSYNRWQNQLGDPDTEHLSNLLLCLFSTAAMEMRCQRKSLTKRCSSFFPALLATLLDSSLQAIARNDEK